MFFIFIHIQQKKKKKRFNLEISKLIYNNQISMLIKKMPEQPVKSGYSDIFMILVTLADIQKQGNLSHQNSVS